MKIGKAVWTLVGVTGVLLGFVGGMMTRDVLAVSQLEIAMHQNAQAYVRHCIRFMH